MGASGEESTILPIRGKTPSAQLPVPTLTVLAHPDPRRMGDVALLTGMTRGASAAISRMEPPFIAPGRAVGAPLADPFLSRDPFYLRPNKNGGARLSRGAGKASVALWEGEIVGETDISPEEIDRGAVIVLAERVVLLLHWSHADDKDRTSDHGLVGHSDSIRFLRREIERVADLATPVLLRGASGTGKELAARAIHQAGRPDKPFVSVNMGAVPPTLAASELFGAVKGSFTGASHNQTGYFRAARGGTLFLDEIGETDPEVQVLLLRALETGEISPVGAQSAIKVDTRLIAATDADLESKMAEDSFKTPLFHRLAGYEIGLPALTDRLEDFGRLFLHFARQELADLGELDRLKPRGVHEDPWLPTSLMVRLLRFGWPGNVRQLRNAVRQLLIGCRGETTLRLPPKVAHMLAQGPDRAALPDPVDAPEAATNAREETRTRRKPSTIGRDELTAALKARRWDIKAAAADLGISRAALYLLIENTPGLQKASDLDVETIRTGLARHGGDIAALADELGVSPRALRRRMTALDLP